MITLRGKYTTADIFSDFIEETSKTQIMQMINSPGVTNPVKIMPDFHAGKGSVIGFTMKVGEYVIPSIVGVDLGCGMLTARITHPGLPLEDVDKIIRGAVPLGFSIHNTAKASYTSNELDLASKVGVDKDRLVNSIGTLGGGNHFIELGEDSDGRMFITIHSGSRNFGLQVANYHQARAREYCKDIPGVQKDLEFCPVDEYLNDMEIAQGYATINRDTILELIVDALGVTVEEEINCIHNYISPEDNIIRKGAVSARAGDSIILPFNRRDGIWIMEGVGNPDWNYSAPHGAGRRMSRGQAKREMNQEYVDLDMTNSGVFSSYNPIDEAPDAYKSPEEIRKYIGETANYLYTIKPILNIKG